MSSSWLIIFFFAGFTWALWTTRNKMATEKSFIKSPTDVIYVATSFLQRWSVLLKEKDRERVQQVLEAIVKWLKNFKPKSTTATDVFEIYSA
jgi:CRISPR/Cas system-associated exonuclease Cas4 (RecB family)